MTTRADGSLKLAATENPSNGTLPDTVGLFTVSAVTVVDDSGDQS